MAPTRANRSEKAVRVTKDMKAVASGNSAFSADMLNGLKDSHPGNLIYSPYSLCAVVAMAKLGARGITADEITRTLRLPADDKTLAKGYSNIIANLKEKNLGFTLSTANRLYANIGFQIEKKFAKTVKDNFRAEVEQVNFSNLLSTAKTINSWVEAATNGKIKNLVRPDALNSDMRLVLVNAVYFKGAWEHPFKLYSSKDPFFLTKTRKVKVQMLHVDAHFPYGEFPDLDAKAISLPYKGDRLAMIVIVPNSITGLGKVEEELKNYSPERILINLNDRNKVAVELPRFKLECTMKLASMLKKLGVSAMFGLNADFSGISKDPDGLFVSEIIQKAFVEVNEEGTEAAAATMNQMCVGSSGHPKIRIPFKADRPFLFQIVDQLTNLVLFAGRCNNPLEQ